MKKTPKVGILFTGNAFLIDLPTMVGGFFKR